MSVNRAKLLLCLAVILEIAALVTGLFGFNFFAIIFGVILLLGTIIRMCFHKCIHDHEVDSALAFMSFGTGCMAILWLLNNALPPQDNLCDGYE